MSSLLHAVKENNLELVKEYFVNASLSKKITALRQACAYNDSLEIVKFFVDNGIDIHLDNEACFRLACHNGKIETVRYLFEKGANIHELNDEALAWATMNNRHEVVSFLRRKILKEKLLKTK